MIAIHLKVVIAATLLVIVAGYPYDFDTILQMIPEDQRHDFLRRHLTIGYELTTRDVKPSIIQILHDLPQEFSVALYQYALKEHPVRDEALLKSLREVVCFPNGMCVDVGDVGVHPFK